MGSNAGTGIAGKLDMAIPDQLFRLVLGPNALLSVPKVFRGPSLWEAKNPVLAPAP
jgi:hypothetical protein